MRETNYKKSRFDVVLDVAAVAGSCFLVLQMLLVCADVISRYLLNKPVPGASEITEMSMLWLTFLGSAWVLRREGHVNVDLLITRMKKSTRAKLTFITSLISAVVFLVIAWYGVNVAAEFVYNGVVTPTILEVPRGPIISVIPVGSLLLVGQFLRRAKKAAADF
jgi:C4-dicarboxylate transporter, DctQ subunit